MLVAIGLGPVWAKDTGPDFNFPADVTKQAEADLKKAMSANDGQLLIDAIVRASVAQSQISMEMASPIVNRIEATLKKERRPEYRALLHYYEARVLYMYNRKFTPEDRLDPLNAALFSEVKDPYAAWGDERFSTVIDSLLMCSVADSAALSTMPVTDFPRIIVTDKLGARYVPTLYQFLLSAGIDLAGPALKERFYDRWERSTVSGPLIAHIFALTERATAGTYSGSSTRDSNCRKILDKYPDAEETGLTLTMLGGDKYYKTFQDYVARHPKSIYANDIRNSITYIERTSINAAFSGHLSSKDSVRVVVNRRNVGAYDLRVYRLPDDMATDAFTGVEYDLARLTRVYTQSVSRPATVPFEARDTIMLPPQRWGRFVVVPVYKNGSQEVAPERLPRGNTLAVYDLASFSVSQSQPRSLRKGETTPENHNRIIVVDGATGAPVSGAVVTLKDKKRRWQGTTDSRGAVAVPDNMGYNTFYYTVSRGDDRYGPTAAFQRLSDGDNMRFGMQMFTDLGIYRPGEQVKWSLVLYRLMVESRAVLPAEKVTVKLFDANSKEIASTVVTTDDFGRANGAFEIPAGRLLGRYFLRATADGTQASAYKDIDVSEYKTPTFYVDMPSRDLAFKPGEPVTVTGRAVTYTDLPVAGAEVKLQLKASEWSWYRHFIPYNRFDRNVGDTIVTTDANGRFSVTWPAGVFDENTEKRYCLYRYTADAQVTNATGESQTAHGYFHIGSKREITLNDPIEHLNTTALRLPLTYNTTEEDSSAVRLRYRILNSKYVAIDSGTFMSDNPVIDLTRMKSGTYHLRVAVEGGDSYYDSSRATLYLYRTTDKAAPVEDVPLWIPDNGYRIDDNNVAHITIGTSTPEAHIYYVAYGRSDVLDEGWIDTKSGFRELTLRVPDKEDEILRVRFMAVSKTNYYEKQITMSSPRNRTAMRVRATSFRNLLTPGKREHWTFQLTDAHDRPQRGAMMLEMYDKALNSLSDNTWSFDPSLLGAGVISMQRMRMPSSSTLAGSWQGKSLDTKSMKYKHPTLIHYDYDLWESCMSPFMRLDYAVGGRGVMYKTAQRAAPMELNAVMAMEESATADLSDDMEGEETQPEVDLSRLEEVGLRMADVKTALWLPSLTSNEAGEISLEFDVPEFNTTWIVQAIAYTQSLVSNVDRREVITQKPIMVRSSLPRFVRHGDLARLAANVSNATDAPADYQAIVEIFDPRTERVLATRTFAGSLEPKASAPLTAQWNVPDTLAYVGFRVKAATADFGDGEQVMIPVLTAISPIVETQPFFIDTEHAAFDYTLPELPENARVTVEYCDNPVWYCVTALPSIFSDNTTVATSLAHSLFALNVARGIANSQPIIAEAFRYWNENARDSMLVSALDRNSDLKIGTLVASPWLRTSERQTMQMQQLAKYFDPAASQAEHNRLVDALLALQRPDGGFTWYLYPECTSSLWTTETVLELLGELRRLGYQPADMRLDDAIGRALTWYDKQYVDRSKRKEYKKATFSSYAYVRSLYPDVAMSKEARKLLDKTVKRMASNWGKTHLSVPSKAYYALTLNRNGKRSEALRLIESVRQFASVKPQLGMYWDQYGSEAWFTPSQVSITSRVLQAMAEVDPRNGELDQVRKWMLLAKRNTDWGGSSLAADAVRALLSCGNQWLERGQSPSITLDGAPVEFDRFDAFVGYCRRDVDAKAGSRFHFGRLGDGPAWGGIYMQYAMPMQEVKANAIDELSITKQVLPYTTDGRPAAGTPIRVGDKVQVRLTITNPQAIDYVTITDERASCLEPADVTSGYRYEEGVGYYRETRDAATNIFINSLSRGTHVITYDAFVTMPGKFSSGIATAQSQQAPEITAHSAGEIITVAE